MTFGEFALRMHPYWFFGALMIWAVSQSSFKDLLRINKKSLLKWTAFMLVLSVYRYFTIRWALHHGIMGGLGAITQLPLGGTLTVFWEDACHTIPLGIINRCLGPSKWLAPIRILATVMIMISFGLGHLYQGIFSAMLLSLYIPFGTKFGESKGFGTLAIGHMIYDFSTLFTVKLLLGF